MHRAVIENLVVDLVGEQHQLVLASQLHHAFQDFLRIDRAGGVVRVDQDQRLGVWRDLGFDVGQVGPPVGLFVAEVMHRLAAGQAHGGRPERIVRRGSALRRRC